MQKGLDKNLRGDGVKRDFLNTLVLSSPSAVFCPLSNHQRPDELFHIVELFFL
jgi:hypothetical protein